MLYFCFSARNNRAISDKPIENHRGLFAVIFSFGANFSPSKKAA